MFTWCLDTSRGVDGHPESRARVYSYSVNEIYVLERF